MSNRITSLCRPLRMSAAQKAVLMCVADRADDQGLAWPSIPGICEWTCLSRTAVIDAMKWLEAQHLINIKKEVGRNNRCLVNTEILERLTPEPVRETDPHQSATQTGTPYEPVREADRGSPPDAPPPVRQTDYTRPADGPEASVSIIQASENHQEQSQAGKHPRSKRRSQIPEDWSLSERLTAWTLAEKPGINIVSVLANFRDHYIAKGEIRADWEASWRTWVRRERVAPRSRHTNFDQRNYEGEPDGSIPA